MSTDQPTMKDLIAKATPGPWFTYDGTLVRHGKETVIARIGRHEDSCTRETCTNALLICRCSPEVMLRVVEALESALENAEYVVENEHIDNILAAPGTAPAKVRACILKDRDQLKAALALLNGGAP